MTIKKNSKRERKIRVKQKIERVRRKGNVKTTKETNKKISQEKGKGRRVDEEQKRKSKRKEDKVLKKIQRGRKRYKEEK